MMTTTNVPMTAQNLVVSSSECTHQEDGAREFSRMKLHDDIRYREQKYLQFSKSIGLDLGTCTDISAEAAAAEEQQQRQQLGITVCRTARDVFELATTYTNAAYESLCESLLHRQRADSQRTRRLCEAARIVSSRRAAYVSERRAKAASTHGYACAQQRELFAHARFLLHAERSVGDHSVPLDTESASVRWDHERCIIPACTRLGRHAQGLCSRHYQQVLLVRKQLKSSPPQNASGHGTKRRHAPHVTVIPQTSAIDDYDVRAAPLSAFAEHAYLDTAPAFKRSRI
jgi:hypothetical protein